MRILSPLLFLSFSLSGLASPPEADRKAILSMAGSFEVSFRFEETASLRSDYEITKPYRESALELVLVVEDSPERIALQHILLVGPERQHVIKHWGQIWTWQDTNLTEYRTDRTWTNVALSEETVAGTWTQRVTQVDDSPRYEGIGKWVHENGISVWQSNEVWRPLPRREHTKRDDYDVLLGVNRHLITPEGWVHEQFNTKHVVFADQPHHLAREFGLNFYRRTEADTGPAARFWEEEGQAWDAMRQAWETVIEREATAGIPQYGAKVREAVISAIAPLTELAGVERERLAISTVEALVEATEPGAQASLTRFP
ncbi:MAG: DUF6607 family protein [Verrucomicrobiota bacterium]